MDEYEYKDVESLTESTEISDTDMLLGFNANEGLQISAELLKQYVLENLDISVQGKTLVIGEEESNG